MHEATLGLTHDDFVEQPPTEIDDEDSFTLQSPSSPYPGLRPFGEAEAGIFFGRERHVGRLLEILQRERFLAVIGPSGSGKSSLVRAGLLPLLPLGPVGTGTRWRVAVVRPGQKPLRSLAEALLKPDVLGDELLPLPARQPDQSVVTLIETALRRGPRSMVDLVDAARGKSRHPEFNLLILVDQFEELFTYAEAGDAQADESDVFVNLLLTAKSAHENKLFVTLTMRTDFLGHCVRFLDLPEAINRAQYLTPRLARDQVREVVTGPAEMFGGGIEPRLVEELINAVQKNSDQLPILQHALARMWSAAKVRAAGSEIRVTMADLSEVGGVDGALSIHGETLLTHLNATQRIDAEWLFRAITDERSMDGGGQRVRRPQTLKRIAEWSGRAWRTYVPIVELFSDPSANFLTYRGQPLEPADGENTVIDLSHESLMRQWATLEKWVTREADGGREYRRLQERMKDERLKTGSLLSGGDLQRAMVWLKRGLWLGDEGGRPTLAWASRYKSAERNTFDDVAAFIHRSDMREKVGKYTLHGLSALLVVASVAVGYFSYSAYNQELNTQVGSLWTDIRINENTESLPASAAHKMFDVAQASEQIRARFALQGVSETRLQRSMFAGTGLVVRGAVGLDDALRSEIASRIRSSTQGKERDKAADASVLGMLGESRFEDWDAALQSKSAIVSPGDLAAHFGAAAAMAPARERSEWVDRLVQQIVDGSRSEMLLLDARSALLSSAMAEIGGQERERWLLTLHDHANRPLEKAQSDAFLKGLGQVAKHVDADQIARFAAVWSSRLATTSTPEAQGRLAQEAQIVSANIPNTLLQPWSVVVMRAVTAPTTTVSLAPALRTIMRRGDGQEGLVEHLIGEASRLGDPLLLREESWIATLPVKVPEPQVDRRFDLARRLVKLSPEGRLGVTGKIIDAAPIDHVMSWNASIAQEMESAKPSERLRLAGMQKQLEKAIQADGMKVANRGSSVRIRARKAASTDGVLRAIHATIDAEELVTLGDDLVGVIQRVPERQLPGLFAALETQLVTLNDDDQIAALMKGLAATAKRFSPAIRREIVDASIASIKLATSRIEMNKRTRMMQVLVLYTTAGEAVGIGTALLGKYAELQNAKFAQVDAESTRPFGIARNVSDMVRRLRASNLQRSDTLGEVLVSVSTSAAKDPAELETWTKALIDVKVDKESGSHINSALVATVEHQPAAAREKLFDHLAGIFPAVARDDRRLAAAVLSSTLGDDDSLDDEEDGGSLSSRLRGSSKSPATVQDGLAILGAKLPDASAEVRVRQFARLSHVTGRHKRLILAALLKGREEPALHSSIVVLLTNMGDAKSTRDLNAIAAVIRAHTRLLSTEHRTQLTEKVSTAMLTMKIGAGPSAMAMSGILSSLLEPGDDIRQAVQPNEKLSRLLIETCKVPYVDRAAIASAIRRGDTEAPREELGQWELLRWAVKKYDVSPNAPPTLPNT
ncbi:hypothetical protein SAMN05444679_10378 [Variovorax sp. CF079]|uniref:ATP-binding protein n=1 Tax=Variovorax sp. CF079 TaxID=1882774 RepID=UPI0008910F61|nr:ATP-binding protein [Variovorax sp. CF079]SDC44244.1 hypothetical protein SAMN05444679_10378 [Variovorax sp. CF079]